MINKEQVLHDIQQMTTLQRYNHVMSALDVVLAEGNKKSEAKADATAIIRLHIKINRETMMSTAGISY